MAIGGASVLWDNGGMVTHPGQGAGGLDVSMAGPGTCNTAGSNVLKANGHFRMADDFHVTGTWVIEQIVVYGYQTGSANPGWTDANLQIWDGRPGDTGSSIVTTFTNPTVAQTNIYRTFNGVLTNTDRRVNSLTFDIPGLPLSTGEYWIAFQIEGGASAWAPYVMEPNPSDPNAPITVAGNGRQLASTGWQFTLGACAGANMGIEIPFLIIGTTHVCTGDLNGDGVVDVSDLLILLGAWGPNPGHVADLNGDGVVDVSDLLILLGAWGACPPPPSPPGACCLPAFGCQENMTEADCIAAGGDFAGPLSTCSACPSAPTGDVCADAIPLTIPGSASGSTVGNPVANTGPCGGVTPSSGTIWFEVVGDGTTLTAATCGSGLQDTAMAVFCNTCTALTCIAGSSEDCPNDPFQAQVSWCAAAGTTYRIAVWGGGTSTGDVTLTLTSSNQGCTPSNIDCGDLFDPVCTLPSANCQLRSGGTYVTSDTGAGAEGFKVADDFHAAATGNITSLCWQGVELSFVGAFGVCPNNLGQGHPFRIRYYNDAGGIPGSMIAEFTGNPQFARTAFIGFAFGNAGLIDYTLSHAPVAVTAGQCYWVEVVQSGPGNHCLFLWAPSDQGNQVSYQSPDNVPYDPTHIRTPADTTNPDRAFCVSIATGDAMDCIPTTGACCAQDQCLGIMDEADCLANCSAVWYGGQNCSACTTASTACANAAAGTAPADCVNGTRPVGADESGWNGQQGLMREAYLPDGATITQVVGEFFQAGSSTHNQIFIRIYDLGCGTGADLDPLTAQPIVQVTGTVGQNATKTTTGTVCQFGDPPANFPVERWTVTIPAVQLDPGNYGIWYSFNIGNTAYFFATGAEAPNASSPNPTRIFGVLNNGSPVNAPGTQHSSYCIGN